MTIAFSEHGAIQAKEKGDTILNCPGYSKAQLSIVSPFSEMIR
jgi:hypothetical protein